MRSHREICTGQPCGCCPTCGAWSWIGSMCGECGHGAQANIAAPAGADRPAAKAPAPAPSDLTSLFDLAPQTSAGDTEPPAKKGIDLV